METFKSKLCFLVCICFAVLDKGFCRISCLTCDSVALPNLCTTIERCGDHEVCGIEQFLTDIGSIRYRQRCMDKLLCSKKKRSFLDHVRADRSSGMVICSECCDTELCNSGGCRQKGFSDDFIGHICYSCDTQIGANMCNEIRQCGRDQICSIEPLDIPGAPTNLFKTACSHPASCEAPTIIGRKRSMHGRCCNSTLCNMFDPGSGSSTAVSTMTTKASTSAHVVSHSTSTPFTTSTEASIPVVSTTPSTSLPHIVTSPPTTKQPKPECPGSASDDCVDKVASCSDTFCKLAVYHDWACTNCRKYCGLCSTVPTSTPQYTCKDKVAGCLGIHCRTPDYMAWATDNCQHTCGICKAPAVESGHWLLMLKTVPGVRPDVYDIWESNRTINSIPEYANITNEFNGDFKPDLSNTWNKRKIDMVTVAMYIKGVEKAFITFNATGEDKLSWFHADNVINSTWSSSLTGLFQMKRGNGTGFEFNAERRTDDVDPCSSSGWMVITTDNRCLPHSSLVSPSLLFCPHSTLPCRWKDGDFMTAEVFAIRAHATGY